MLYISTKIHENISIAKFSTERNSVKHIDEVKNLVLCTLPDDALNLYQVL